MNTFGSMASEIYSFEFDGDSSITSISAISGWLQSNLGKLNTVIYSDFSGDGSDISVEAQAIHKELYLYSYYSKQARKALRGIVNSSASSDGSNILSVKDADSEVRFVNKNEVSKVYRGLASDSKETLDKLVAYYNIYSAEPRQLAGIESSFSGVFTASEYRGSVFL
jgi:hypothetical protein